MQLAPEPAEHVCGACGIHNPATSRFCSACGARLGHDSAGQRAGGAATTPGTTMCARCRGANPTGTRFCQFCGASLPAGGSSAIPAPNAALVVIARDGDRILTSDPDDILRLAAAAGRDVEVVEV